MISYPLIDQLKEEVESDRSSFHVPGHNHGRALASLLAYAGTSLERLDYTEIPGLDNLHAPEDVILESQAQAASLYGAMDTFYVVGGSTNGLQSLILASTSPGDTVAVARNCHKSVHSALILGDLNPIYIQPQRKDQLDLTLGVTLEAVQELVGKNPHVKALVFTSPTYEGIHSNIKAICTFCHQHGITVIVDEAHGAHLPAHGDFGHSALAQGADGAVQSIHKTLGGLTQAAVVHRNSDRISREMLQQWLGMLQTTSPSYLLMASIEWSIGHLFSQGKQQADHLLGEIDALRRKVHMEPTVRLLTEDDVLDAGFTHDPSRLVLFTSGAQDLEWALRHDHQIQVEYATGSRVVLVPSLWTTPQDFERLAKAISAHGGNGLGRVEQTQRAYPQPNQVIGPRAAFYGKKKWCSLEEAEGAVSGGFVIPYPPGIPVLAPGEGIDRDMIMALQAAMGDRRQVMGLQQGMIQIMKGLRAQGE